MTNIFLRILPNFTVMNIIYFHSKLKFWQRSFTRKCWFKLIVFKYTKSHLFGDSVSDISLVSVTNLLSNFWSGLALVEFFARSNFAVEHSLFESFKVLLRLDSLVWWCLSKSKSYKCNYFVKCITSKFNETKSFLHVAITWNFFVAHGCM